MDPSVLIVEDEEVIRDVLVTVFGREGFGTRCAGSVAEAMAELRTPPTHLTLDLHLPDGRGTEVLKRVREQCPATKVAVTTGAIDRNLLAQVTDLKPDGVFQKPFRASELVAWIRSHDPE